MLGNYFATFGKLVIEIFWYGINDIQLLISVSILFANVGKLFANIWDIGNVQYVFLIFAIFGAILT